MVFVAISRINISQDMAHKLESSFRKRGRKVDSVDGFLGLYFLRSIKNPNDFRGIFRFRDKESFTKYMKSDLHKLSHDNTHKEINDAINSNSLEFFTEITD